MIARIRKSMEEKDQGFTLIELLVVMIIIGILAAIAIPVFLNQQKKARDTSAKADVSTIGKDVTSYYVDGTGTLSISSATNAAGLTQWTLKDTGTYTDGPNNLSKGNTLGTNNTFTSVSAFCVAVKTSDGNFWSYTQNGLASGDCTH